MKKSVLRQAMKSKGITAYMLSKELGYKSKQVYNILSGRYYAYPKFRKRISEILGEPEDKFFDEDGNLIPLNEEVTENGK